MLGVILQVVEVVVGVSLVGITLADAIGTLVVTRGLTARWLPTRGFYSATWRMWRALGQRFEGTRREAFLSAYAPLTLLGLLAIWLLGLLVGWALVYLGAEGSLEGDDGFLSLVYYSGTCLFTLGFGDILATNDWLRVLALLEAGTGVATMALAISYLPALYGAYGRREARLLTLDDPSGTRLTPSSIVVQWAPDGDLSRLYQFFAEWEAWTADILESHVSYPMLALFRSQHSGQSWITALGVVTDAATITCSTVPGADRREPYFMYRRGRRALHEIARRLPQHQVAEGRFGREHFDVGYERLRAAGLPVRSADEAWERQLAMRSTYATTLQSLIDYLLAPAGFWGHSAEDADDPALM